MNICTRQVAFIGPKNQEKLSTATIAIVGVGALGSASAHLLARMGVGKLILCDDDVVADHNLGRQHLYTAADVGQKKVQALKSRLFEIREDIEIEVQEIRIDESTVSCCKEADIIVDGSDNHATRRVIDTFCKQQNVPWVHGASIEDKGTVIFFPPTINYDGVYAGKTKDQHCSISGVLVTATTAVATLQTQLTFLYLTGQEIPQVMYHLNGLDWTQITLK